MCSLAPQIHSQPLVIEGMPAERIAAVDIYTCMDFSAEAAVRFTEKWLATPEIEFEEF